MSWNPKRISRWGTPFDHNLLPNHLPFTYKGENLSGLNTMMLRISPSLPRYTGEGANFKDEKP